MMDLHLLVERLKESPLLLESLTFQQLVTFYRLSLHLKLRIKLNDTVHATGPPEALPQSVHAFLCDSIGISDDVCEICWSVLAGYIWESTDEGFKAEECIDLFLTFGERHGIGYNDFYPPTLTCLHCKYKDPVDGSMEPLELKEPRTHEAAYFSKDNGALPAWTTSLYCRNCKTRYYHNYFVNEKATKRSYYIDLPQTIQAGKHYFLDRKLCEQQADAMVLTWASATNLAQIYNIQSARYTHLEALENSRKRTYSMSMTAELVWDAFFLNALLNDHSERRTTLQLWHEAPNQAERIRPALAERNLRMAGPGQKQWSHSCTQCTWFRPSSTGGMYAVRATVTDGITIGHPCCAVHDCKEPLRSQRERFCPNHMDLSTLCAVVSCSQKCTPGSLTCHLPEHSSLEKNSIDRNKAMFQLKQRLQRANLTQTNNSLPTYPGIQSEDEFEGPGIDEGDVEEDLGAVPQTALSQAGGEVQGTHPRVGINDTQPTCEGKPENGNSKIRAEFGRHRTHNEELCVSCCGVILGRATFFGSEAPNGVRLFWKGLFPTKKSLPQYIFFDSNCKVLQHIEARGDQGYFENCGLPVDVFHFKAKHKEGDIFCSQNCNPAAWPDLTTQDGKWRFNSSAAEQTNVWFGGFQAIVREMRVDRYNFFLDEMIQRRNELVVRSHREKGFIPHLIPRSDLLA